MNLLEQYAALLQKQLACEAFAEEEHILNEMDKLWYKMSGEERLAAEILVAESL